MKAETKCKGKKFQSRKLKKLKVEFKQLKVIS